MIGLSLSDTCALTLEEFNILYEEWDRYRTAVFRTSWEQARFMAHCSVMPHVKKGLVPTDIVCFDWEKEDKKNIRTATKADFERMKKRFGES